MSTVASRIEIPEPPAAPARASDAGGPEPSGEWRARGNPFVKLPIEGLAPGVRVKSTRGGNGKPYEVLKVAGGEFVACREVKSGGKASLKAYVLANDANYFTVCPAKR